jgi:hypothetical protein
MAMEVMSMLGIIVGIAAAVAFAVGAVYGYVIGAHMTEQRSADEAADAEAREYRRGRLDGIEECGCIEVHGEIRPIRDGCAVPTVFDTEPDVASEKDADHA